MIQIGYAQVHKINIKDPCNKEFQLVLKIQQKMLIKKEILLKKEKFLIKIMILRQLQNF